VKWDPSKSSRSNGVTLLLMGGGGFAIGVLVLVASALLPQLDIEPAIFAFWFGVALLVLIIGGVWAAISGLRA
jgi:hypothetical protein